MTRALTKLLDWWRERERLRLGLICLGVEPGLLESCASMRRRTCEVLSKINTWDATSVRGS